MPADPIVLIAPVRTPIGRFGGALASLSAPDLGTAAAEACLERSGVDPSAIDQTIFGHARQAGGGPNSARQIAYRAGIPVERPAFTVNQACGSGLQAVLEAARAIRLGEAGLVLAGGTESMSNTPYMLPQARWGHRLGHAELTDGMYKDGFNDPLSGLVMGETAEVLAERSGISREQADRYAAESQNRCEAARERGRFDREIAPIDITDRKKNIVTVAKDEHPRSGVTAESLARLKTVFRDGGTVTAGNASGITDGAAAVLVASEERARELGLLPDARLIDWSVVGVAPEVMGIGPVPAVERLLEQTGIEPASIDQVELNEAFASQVLACLKELPFERERVNPDGGAIALGHPIGCTGARILTTLIHGLASRGASDETDARKTGDETDARKARLGIATLCVSGGMGLAALVETSR